MIEFNPENYFEEEEDYSVFRSRRWRFLESLQQVEEYTFTVDLENGFGTVQDSVQLQEQDLSVPHISQDTPAMQPLRSIFSGTINPHEANVVE